MHIIGIKTIETNVRKSNTAKILACLFSGCSRFCFELLRFAKYFWFFRNFLFLNNHKKQKSFTKTENIFAYFVGLFPKMFREKQCFKTETRTNRKQTSLHFFAISNLLQNAKNFSEKPKNIFNFYKTFLFFVSRKIFFVICFPKYQTHLV